MSLEAGITRPNLSRLQRLKFRRSASFALFEAVDRRTFGL